MSKEESKVLLKNRSRSPLGRMSTNNEGESPFRSTPKTVSLKRLDGPEVDVFIKKLQSNRENLCTCFDIYELLFQNGVPQRCILHNNFVTLYCQDEQKLLCVNCVYDSVKHKDHAVGPIKRSFDNIREDNRMNEKRLRETVEALTKLHEKSFKITVECKEGLETTLRDLNEEYDAIQRILVEKYEIARESIIEKYTDLSSKYKILEK